MRIGFIGLGKMGKPMVLNLLAKGFQVVAFTPTNVQALREVEAKGATIAKSIKEIPSKLAQPRIIMLEIPAGSPIDNAIADLSQELSEGDIIIDAGNSYYKDQIKRAEELKKKGIYYLDAGTSGGIEGAAKGASFYIGGDKKAFEIAEPIFKALAAPGAYAYFGSSGSGHFVKLVHNGLLVALLQAYGEAFAMLKASPYNYDLAQVAEIWKNGSVVRSWLVELAARAFSKNPNLENIEGWIGGGQTGRWCSTTAMEMEVPTPVINLSLDLRYLSRQVDSFAAKVVAALRYEFGGHEYKKKH
ncbi:decarboxylating 6-phosphogluconate dehydrogenase [Candidatus Bathyarchaeota archaeon]|nr:decarboxylating 6-phosphogluconate dehydrogenase [Candidatus Bathyarchaeota archaeon]